MRFIKIFDTTLRDGAQSASAMLKIGNEIKVAEQLERLNVDMIEAGFPASSKAEQDIVGIIARESSKTIAALARAKKEDVKKAWHSIRRAKKPRFHIFIASSDDHIKNKLNMSRQEVVNAAVESIKYAKEISNGNAEIEFSAEDATRSNERFLFQLYNAAIKAGAGIINIPDTVGFFLPNEFFRMVRKIRKRFPLPEVSVHCHNDLGLAVANSIAAIHAGANQVHCTMNGIGERAGNAALEEIATILTVKKNSVNACSNIKIGEIYKTAQIVSKYFGVGIPVYKAVIGANAMKHEAGIHVQHVKGYEAFNPEYIGAEREIIIGRHSGIHTVLEVARINRINIGKEEAIALLNEIKKKGLKISQKDFKRYLEQKA
ncbi:2-isopropylmalate synthase [Candidatus Pacearchaeota archaeon]|nr:2-isopropylmalate synthase [Candidatus Pacearchaeota archaeon]